MRLVGTQRNAAEGRLEVFYNGSWGTVCDDSFTDNAAKVACNGLGFGYVVYSHFTKCTAAFDGTLIHRHWKMTSLSPCRVHSLFAWVIVNYETIYSVQQCVVSNVR